MLRSSPLRRYKPITRSHVLPYRSRPIPFVFRASHFQGKSFSITPFSPENMSGCNCGSSCGCGSDCKCGKMYPDLGSSEKATTAVTIITGVAPVKMHSEGSETSLEGGKGCKSGNACKCGNNCNCDPCNC